MAVDARGGGAPDRFDSDDAHDPPALCAHVVRHTDEPDRVTVCPQAVSAADHTTAWLSVDADAVVSLADAR
jgi:hypothetical protein